MAVHAVRAAPSCDDSSDAITCCTKTEDRHDDSEVDHEEDCEDESSSEAGSAANSDGERPSVPVSPAGSTMCGSPALNRSLSGTELRRTSRANSLIGSPCRPTASESSCVRLPPVNAPRSPTSGTAQTVALRFRGGCRCYLSMTVTAQFEGVEVRVALSEGEAELIPSLAGKLPMNVPVTGEFKSSGVIAGTLHVNDVPPIPFGIQTGALVPCSGERKNFVATADRQRTVVTHASELEVTSGTSVKGDGMVVEVAVSSGPYAEMTVLVRRARKKELTRVQQERALLTAMEKKKYSSLLAQITKSRSRKVEAALIDQAGKILKTIVRSEESFLNHQQLKKMMKWKRVSGQVDTGDIVESCSCSDCPCNAGQGQPGEICDVSLDAVHVVLDGVAPDGVEPDKWLFQGLVKAAITAPEGCVWKSGGKFLLTNEERNQSANAIVNLLERDAENDAGAGKGIRALVNFTENKYDCRVTAVQINFHPNQKSFHKQHRDIYGAGQKGGINCTCSFMKCSGTVCYSLGSSRQVLCETISDSRSKYEPCGDDCTGRKVFKWLHSGSAMYFNDKWNNNHTHGIPRLEDECGPRISVALLLA
eukprot:gnl/TRDRNA2_/TRDRNA2_147470_c0_seq1.p1 gnl/TRDRNA2_/TRDRNA2_147470_c0~~gnl/TRDRNA2_/TRDRNA2_147470_c0_seq1.p1  ORF type:complete len:609 (-),score=92.26 gnl/TRDRNA2_/TRDRNA2_147470_c0_seq1:122-1894(-)